MASYTIETADVGTDGYSPQPGVPHVVHGLAGLRRALRALRNIGYDAVRGDWAVKVERLMDRKDGEA